MLTAPTSSANSVAPPTIRHDTIQPPIQPPVRPPVDPPVESHSTVTLEIVPWHDPTVDLIGHDARSTYVERFWLGVLGPSSTWLLRITAYGFEHQPEGFLLECAQTARILGLGDKCGRHSSFMRSVERLATFDLALTRPDGAMAIRRFIPWLPRRYVARLPQTLQNEHSHWEATRLANPGTVDDVQRNAAQLALSLTRIGRDVGEVERSLAACRFHPSLCRSMAEWAARQLGADHGEPQ